MTRREWLAKKIVDSRVHPDTGDIIPAPLRMCGYAVFGSPIVIGMLLPNPAGELPTANRRAVVACAVTVL